MADNSYVECRLFCWKGGFLQEYANAKLYVLIFGIIGLVQSAVNAYQVAIITTVERRFQIPSKLSGLIVSGIDIGTCICVAYLAFYGTRLHKPRSVGFGIILTTFTCFLWLLPHIIYGQGASYDHSEKNVSGSLVCEMGSLPDAEVCKGGKESSLSVSVFLVGNILYGIGTCFYWTLGMTYIDDNANKSKTPLYLSVTMLIRMFGPALGYMLATYSLSVKALKPTDSVSQLKSSEWIGAWWLGFIILSIFLVCLLPVACAFPTYIPKSYNRKVATGGILNVGSKSTIEEFKLMCRRLMKNKIFICNTVSSTLFVFGEMGMGVFGPKYLESQFWVSPSEASFITGSIGLLSTGLGVLSSGVAITYFKPSSEKIALWNVVVESLDVFGHIIYAFLGCPSNNLQGHWGEHSEWILSKECNEICGCPPTIMFTPVCSEESHMLFYSPCHAGCALGSFNETFQMYENCKCAPSLSLFKGSCQLDSQCKNEFYAYIIILSVLQFFAASGRAGNTLLQFRSVKEGDKAVSIAVTEGIMSVFAFVPSPIIFGYLLDYTCIVWGESCGGRGNCWLYDSRLMRYFFNFIMSGFLLLGTVADVFVWLYSSEVDMFDQDRKLPSETVELDTLFEDSKINSQHKCVTECETLQ